MDNYRHDLIHRHPRTATPALVALIALIALIALVASACRRSNTTTPVVSAQATPAGAGTALAPGDYTRTVKVDGQERHYNLHVPPGTAVSQPLALVLVFHGGLGNGQNVAAMTGFNPQADAAGFLAVYPDGSGRLGDKLLTWNAGACCAYAQEHNLDDVGFVRALLDDVGTLVPVDPKRVYATGISNGAMMSYRLACDLSDRFAAIAPVSGTQNYAACAPAAPVAVLHIHGTADQHVPYDGGRGAQSLVDVDFQSVASSIAFWTAFDQCPAAGVTTQSGAVAHTVYSPCAQGTAVELYTIDGGGHAWPGGASGWPGGDPPTAAPDATRLIWEFFAAHPKP